MQDLLALDKIEAWSDKKARESSSIRMVEASKLSHVTIGLDG